MKQASIFLVLVVCLCLAASQGFAQDLWEKAESEVYKEKVGPMFVRGLLNAGTSPVDLLVQTVDKTKDGPPLIGTLTGMASGLGCTALRAGSGIVDVALFWVPGFNGFPVNRSYHDCLLCKESTKGTPVYTPVPQTVVATPVYTAPVPSKPLVTVTEEPSAPMPQKKIRDPYQYVKK